jgi:hypothetical protein
MKGRRRDEVKMRRAEAVFKGQGKEIINRKR